VAGAAGVEGGAGGGGEEAARHGGEEGSRISVVPKMASASHWPLPMLLLLPSRNPLLSMSKNDVVILLLLPSVASLDDKEDNGAKGRDTLFSSKLLPLAAVDTNVGNTLGKSIIIIGVGIIIIS